MAFILQLRGDTILSCSVKIQLKLSTPSVSCNSCQETRIVSLFDFIKKTEKYGSDIACKLVSH